MARAVRGGSTADTILVAVCGALSLVATVLPPRLQQPISDGLRRTLLSPLVALQARAEHGRIALIARDSVVRETASSALERMTASSLRSENDRLRKLLGLGARLQWGFVPAEALHDRSRPEEHTLWLTAGSRAGVKTFSPVVAPEGLVGMVRTVDADASLVILSAHPDFRVSAMSADESAFGIVQAHLGTGSARYLLELHGVPFRSTLKPGTLLVSSGIGGVYHRGIPIGTVLGELTNEGWARTYLVRPAVLPPDVTTVMVLQSDRMAAGMRDVWAQGAPSDSARRGVVTAGDSLVREAAQAELAARRRQRERDSTSRAAAADTTRTPRPDSARPARRDTTRVDTVRPPRRDSARRDTGTRPPE